MLEAAVVAVFEEDVEELIGEVRQRLFKAVEASQKFCGGPIGGS
jgi:hypothetical protein